MPKISFGPQGVNAGFGGGNSAPELRGKITGWSKGAARRNKRFLMTVDPEGLTGDGYALSLTVGRTPDTLEEWQAILKRYFDRLRRMGALRCHWVVEWQARGAPHLHMSVYFPERSDNGQWAERYGAMENHWLDLTGYLGTHQRGQHIVGIRNAAFWGAYMAKHAARGQEHYQRQQGLLPDAWETSGRMWGKFGDWPTREEAFDCDPVTFYRWRRMIRGWQRSKMVSQLKAGRLHGNRRQITAAKTLLNFQKKGGRGSNRSRVLGIGTFCPEDVSRRMLDVAMDHEEGFVTAHQPTPPADRRERLIRQLDEGRRTRNMPKISNALGALQRIPPEGKD